MSYATVGRPVPRVDGVEKVTGREAYAADVTLPGTLWAKVLRSTVPRGRLVRVDTSRAQTMPGVRVVLTGADIPPFFVGQRVKDMPILARDEVRYVGEPIAAVAAESAAIAEEAIDSITVEYEELPAVLDPLTAMEPSAPLLHAEASSYKNAADVPAGAHNLQGFALFEHGDLDAAMQRADRFFEHTFRTPLTHHGYLEPHACTVWVEADGRVQVWASNKAPFLLRDMLSEDLGIPADRITVHILSVGGDFGGKSSIIDAPIAYVLSERARLPVKLILGYDEELIAAAHRHPAVITLRTGVSRDGVLQAMSVRAVFSGGAYACFKHSPQGVVMGPRQTASCYRIPAIRIENYCVYTNHVPCTQTRAPGAPQIVFAVESHLDLIARDLGIDPVELRLRNLLEDGDSAPLGQKWQQIRARETLQKAADVCGWGGPKPSPSFGRGIAIYERGAAAGRSGAALTIEHDGRVRVGIGVPDVGPGTSTVVRQIVAETLGVPVDQVAVEATDTDNVPYDSGVGGSKSTNSPGNAAHRAALELRERLLIATAHQMECSPEEINVLEGRLIGPGGQSLSIGDAARLVSPSVGLSHVAVFEPGSQAPVTSFCVQVAEVEVDPETGQVRVQQLFTVHDVGTIINDVTHQGQIDGGLIQGLGYGLMEENPIEDGRITTAHLGDFKIPTSADTPPLRTVLLEPVDGPVPFQGKAIGEIPNVPTAAAIVNAVHDAVGVRLYELPATAEKIVAALHGDE